MATSMDREKLLDRTRKDLRSVLISAPRGVPLSMLLRDFRQVLGSELPFRQLGFQRVEDFLRSIPDVVRVDRGVTGEPTCFAVADASTSQIARFVALQKKPKLKKSNAPPLTRKPVYSGFTKKSKFGPSSARPKRTYPPRMSPQNYPQSYPGRGTGGAKFVGPGSVFTGGPPLGSRQSRPAAYNYGKGNQNTARYRGQQQQHKPPKSPSQGMFSYLSNAANTNFTNKSSYTSNSTNYNTFNENFGGNRRPLIPVDNSRPNFSGNSSLGSGGGFNRTPGPVAAPNPGTGWHFSGNSSLGSGGGFNRTPGPVAAPNPGTGWVPAPSSVVGYAHSGGGATGASSGANSYSEKIGKSAIKASGPSPPRSFTSKLADPNVAKCPLGSISSLVDKTRRGDESLEKFTCVEGFIARDKQHDTLNQTVKYLLYSGLDGSRQGVFPAVMLFFKRGPWDIDDQSQDFQKIPMGSKLKVCGVPMALKSKTKGIYEPAIKVYTYTYETASSSSSGHLTTSSSNKSRSSSPGSSRGVSPSHTSKSAVAPQDLQRLIYELLKARPSGIWFKRLGSEFKKIHGVEAPQDVTSIAMSLSFVEQDEVAEDNWILKLKENVPAPFEALPPAKQQPAQREVSKSVAKSTMTFTTKKPPLPDTVEFTTVNGFVDVYVAFINNPISFYLQQIGEGFSDKLQSMTEAMDAQLSKSRIKPVSGVKVNELYGYLWEESDGGSLWCRVLTNSVSGKVASVYFPDYGNTEEVKVAELVELPREFYQLPFQAVHCCLHGCPGVREEATDLFTKLALEKICVAQVMDNSGTRLAVELIDSESESGDTTINSDIMSALHPVSTLVPKLPEPGEPRVPVILTDIDEDGMVTVQLRGPGVNRLQQLMTLINEKYKKSHAADFVKTVTEGRVYCTQFSADKKFYRVVVKKGIPHKLLVQYVDYGNQEETEIKRLRKPLSDPLFSLPPQAVKCGLEGLPPAGTQWSEGATYMVANYLDCEDLYLTTVKVGDVPTVRLTVSEGGEEGDEDLLLNEQLLQEFENLSNEEESILDAAPGTYKSSSLDTSPSSSLNSSLSVGKGHPITTEVSSTLVPVSGKPEGAMLGTKREVCSAHTTTGNDLTKSHEAASISEITTGCANLSINTSSSLHVTSTSPMTPSTSPMTPPSPYSGSPSTKASSDTDTSSSTSSKCLPLTPIGSPGCQGDGHTPRSSPPTSSSGYVSPLGGGSAPHVGMASGKLSFASLSSEYAQAVCVISVESPNNFVIQLLSGLAELDDMMTELNRVVSKTGSSLDPLEVIPGLLCTAFSSVDEQWYRACVVPPGKKDQVDSSNVMVEFLDYGGTEVVHKSMLKPLPLEFLHLPFQGIACTLQAVEPVDGQDWSEDSMRWFNDYVLEKDFFAVKLLEVGNHSCITLLDTSGGKTVDVRDALKDAGFAKFQVQLT